MLSLLLVERYLSLIQEARATLMATRPRERILESATKLFSKHGIETVGVQRIVADAAVAPMTLYRHFRSKDVLVAAALERWSIDWFGWLEAGIARRDGAAATPVEGLWDAFEEWFLTDQFQGSLIENAAAELRSRPDHPAWEIIAAHRLALRRLLEELAEIAGASDPRLAAEQLQLIADGAITAAMVDHRPAIPAGVRALAGTVLPAAAA
jgi:AcrR family transcriptional regulator